MGLCLSFSFIKKIATNSSHCRHQTERYWKIPGKQKVSRKWNSRTHHNNIHGWLFVLIFSPQITRLLIVSIYKMRWHNKQYRGNQFLYGECCVKPKCKNAGKIRASHYYTTLVIIDAHFNVTYYLRFLTFGRLLGAGIDADDLGSAVEIHRQKKCVFLRYIKLRCLVTSHCWYEIETSLPVKWVKYIVSFEWKRLHEGNNFVWYKMLKYYFV